ncbi:zinc ribbon domain-containing protein [Salinarchaeum sp. IM2453]|uniref:double zinc ribbon domain-containing protein n=1 Tax=Salinarchaeum sp. IM2453 TaxID=2862870 RepID=UPI001C83DE92|nr:zinc ribbon domain-containing protein [Salinarchaeum sp. IM2453]QZA87470.1 zinc ribbon domain-containing protein [Salinarchaeum sp. IM2453]
MSKITFRADQELIDELERFDASKSEIMRRALRAYLDSHPQSDPSTYDDSQIKDDTIDGMIATRVDELIKERLGQPTTSPQDVNINISLDAESERVTSVDASRKTEQVSSQTPSDKSSTCDQCGELVDDDHVYCPNCGEKVSQRVFCECGDELRSDWGFCPSCGRRTPAADVLDPSDQFD